VEDEDQAADDESDDASETTPAPWQTPLRAEAETTTAPEPPRKRKPWWRPGD
jgi:hypothetical protein